MATPIETGALSNAHVQIVRRYQAAIAQGDFATAATVFQPDVVYEVSGNNRFSGTYYGPQAVMDYLGKLVEFTSGTYAITTMQWLIDRAERVLLVTENHAQAQGRDFTWQEAILFTFKEEKKARIDLFAADQAGVDAFFGQVKGAA